MSALIGKAVLHYRIFEQIGQGGMGVVYKAEDTRLKRDVAIKFLPREIAASEEDRARFKNEAQASEPRPTEQAQGMETDHSTDIWAFGVVLYEMLSYQEIGDVIVDLNSLQHPVTTTPLATAVGPTAAKTAFLTGKIGYAAGPGSFF